MPLFRATITPVARRTRARSTIAMFGALSTCSGARRMASRGERRMLRAATRDDDDHCSGSATRRATFIETRDYSSYALMPVTEAVR